ncbi:MAG TPA: hypothetical protein DCS87_11605 [Rheinheimera sp.]|nr:hypothetical protein [Rheinheimera sp.]
MLNLSTIQSLESVSAAAEVQQFKVSRQQALDNAVVTTTAGNQYNADEKSIGRMANALLASLHEPESFALEWSMADTPTGVMTPTTKADLAQAHRLAVENMAAIWGR